MKDFSDLDNDAKKELRKALPSFSCCPYKEQRRMILSWQLGFIHGVKLVMDGVIKKEVKK